VNSDLYRNRGAIFWIFLSLVLLIFLGLVRSIMLPFAVAMAVAYFFDPLANHLQKSGLPRWLSALLVLTAFVVLFVGAAFIVIPIIEKQLGQLITLVPGWFSELKSSALPKLNTYLAHLGLSQQGDLADTASSYMTQALSGAGAVLTSIWTGGLAVLDLVSLMLVTPVVAFYLLRDWNYVVRDLDGLLPRQHLETLRRLFHEIDRTLSGFIRGQALVCLIQMVYYATVLSIAGLDFGVLVGITAGVLTFIPYLGATIGLITALFIAISEWHDMLHVLVVLGLFAFGQILEANVITPRLVGDRIGLHPVWVIFAVLAGGAMFGFTGILLGVPVAAVVGVLVRFLVGVYTKSDFYQNRSAPV
jgi:predicted PurR-regulated permease PerM